MKKSILVLTATVAMVLVGCKENPYIAGPGDNSKNTDSIPVIVEPEPTPDPEGIVIPEGCLTVTEAIKICQDLGPGGTTQEKRYVKGWVQSLDEKNADGIYSYGNATFYMAESNTGKNRKTFEAYQVYGKDGKKFYDVSQVQVGDFVIIYGPLTLYNRTAETVGKGAASMYYSTNPGFDPQMDPTNITPDPEGADVPAGTINVYEALHISDSIGSGKTSSTEYYIKGWVCRLDSKHADGVKDHGNGTFYIAAANDGSANAFTFEAYQVYGKNKQKLTDPNQVQVGDFVVLRGKLTNYNGTAETVGKGASYIYYSTNPLW